MPQPLVLERDRWSRGPRGEEGRAARARRRRTILKGSSHNAIRVTRSQTTAWISSARSRCDRDQNLWCASGNNDRNRPTIVFWLIISPVEVATMTGVTEGTVGD